MVSGTTLTAGEVSNGWIRRLTKAATGMGPSPCSLMHPASIHPRDYSRDDKRYTEKKNKSERARRKKEDTAKLRGLVDVTLR